MTEIMEAQANELLRHREWTTALDLFDRLLSHAVTTKCASKERIVCYLLARSECCLELGRHEAVVLDCRKIIKLLTGVDSVTNNGARARRRLVHALFTLQRFSEAEAAAAEWIASSRGLVNYNQEAVKMLEHVRIVLQMIDRGRRTSEDKVAGVGPAPDYCGEPWFYEEMRRSRNHPVKLIEPTDIQLRNNRNDEYAAVVHVNHRVATSTPAAVPLHNSAVIDYRHQAEVPGMRVAEVEPVKMLCCSYCGISFSQRSELRAHCQSESHQTVIMSDEGRDWTWRPPPRGLTADSYTICENWAETGCCRFGAQCVEAHGTEELTEWQERFEYRRMKLQRACEKELYGKSYTEQLLDKLLQSAQPTDVMKDKIDGVEDSCSVPLVISVSSKNSKNSWTFTMNTSQRLRAVALLQDNYRNHFFLTHVATSQDCKTILDYSLNNEQEFTNGLDVTGGSSDTDEDCNLSHTVTVEFSTDIYGTFRQSVVFDFGTEPVLVKHLCVDVIPVTDADKIKEIRKELILSSTERWDKDNSTIVPFSSPVVGPNANETDRERELMAAYPTPQPDTFTVTQATVTEKRLTRNNYRARMHELLSIEEMARYDLVARYNLQARLLITKNYLLSPVCVGASTAKYAHNGELFALMNLTKDLSEDTSAGRLILSSCLTVLLSMVKKDPDGESDKNELRDSEYNEKQNSKRVVYEALIEDKGKNAIYLRLSASTVQALNLKPETKVVIDVQFQLNRIPYCEWHQAIDKIADFRFIFPDTYLEPTIPWSPQRQWNDSFDPKLNLKQKEAVIAITTPTEVQLPPILIIGPFGTGKTYTLAQAIKQVLKQPGTRILVCTHSNSAADLYIKDYLHPYVEAGHEEARPLRIFYHKRWVASVSPVVQKYAMVDINEQGARSFKIPKVEDILKYRVIVVTLSISMYLSTIGLPKGYFTHILLDEAAQAMECEAIMPLALANDNTRIVLAGDHMQLSPELFSQFAKERNLHMSLLERLYDHYLSNFPCKILLCENYRAHEAIIQFTSELFYEQKLISSGKQPKHEQFYPLTFFTTRGEDVQDLNSTAFYNNAEVYEVVERVSELKKRWPSAWGKLTDQSIGIMTPYADQVFRIRSELRKRRLGGISVERVLNVQGKQFRAVFLSTVRTRRTCDPSSSVEMEYGFLSNSKLLNTAITRAQSLVAVVGDPIALCSVGRCRKVWERFIDICHKNGSLYGIAWSSLRSQLDGVELKKTYTLNPLAPEFVPRQYQVNQYMQKPVVGTFTGGVAAAAAAAAAAMRFPPHFVPQVPAIYQAVPAVYYPAYPAGAPVQCAPPPPQAPPPQLYPAPPGAAWGLYQTVLPPPPQIHQQQLKRSTELSPPVRHDDIRAAVAAQPPPGLAQLPQVRIPAQIPLSNTNIQVINNYTSPQPQVLRTPQFITAAEIPRQIHIPRRIQDKLDIQFLQNVHFPERQNPGPVLPANMTLEELLASQQKQFEWYNHLLDTLGPEAAAKFREFIAQVQKKIPHQVTDIVRNMDEMYIERLPPSMCNGHIPNGHHQPPMQVVPPPHMPPSSVSNYLVSLAVERAAALEDGLAMGEPPPLEEEMPRSSVPLYQRGHHQQVQQQQVVTVSRPSSTHQQQQVGGPDHLKQVQHQQQQQQQQMVSRGICPNSDVGRQMTYASVLRSRKEEQQKAEQMASISPLAILKELGNKQSGLYHYFS